MTNTYFYCIGDFPPRGFCNPFAKPCPINPDDRLGPLQAPSLFKTIDEKCLKFNAMQIKPIETAFMVEQFKKLAASVGASQRFHAYNMTDGVVNDDTVRETIRDTISESILRSIMIHLNLTTHYLDNPDSEPNRCIKL